MLAAKQNELLAAGAEVPAPPTPMRKVESQNIFIERKIGSLDHHLSGTFYPLRAASWEGVAADLEGPSWAADLVAAGFDPRQPTVFVAEGLLMYLEPASVAALLRKVAGAGRALQGCRRLRAQSRSLWLAGVRSSHASRRGKDGVL